MFFEGLNRLLSSRFIYVYYVCSNSFSEEEKNEAAQSGLMGRENKKEKNSIKPEIINTEKDLVPNS